MNKDKKLIAVYRGKSRDFNIIVNEQAKDIHKKKVKRAFDKLYDQEVSKQKESTDTQK